MLDNRDPNSKSSDVEYLKAEYDDKVDDEFDPKDGRPNVLTHSEIDPGTRALLLN